MSTAATSVEELSEILPDRAQCPLCLGEGDISRAELLDRLGMKDLGRIAEITASQALQLLLKQEKQSESTRWQKFELELTKRLADVTQRHQVELQKLQTEKNEIAVRLKQFRAEQYDSGQQRKGTRTPCCRETAAGAAGET